MSIVLYDDIIEKYLVDEIEHCLSDEFFPWYFQNSTLLSFEDCGLSGGPLYDFQFTHVFFNNDNINSEYAHNVLQIFNCITQELNIKVKKLTRSKANLLTVCSPTELDLECQYHVDSLDQGMHSILYYVSDSDGDTIFKNENNVQIASISPKKGRVLMFDSNITHRATNPKNHKRRVVINYIFQVQ